MNAIMYTKDKVSARSGAGMAYEAVAEIDAGEPVVATGKTENEWYQFYYEGDVAYIPGDKLKEPPVNASLLQGMEEHAQE